jgi:hypothetical protein
MIRVVSRDSPYKKVIVNLSVATFLDTLGTFQILHFHFIMVNSGNLSPSRFCSYQPRGHYLQLVKWQAQRQEITATNENRDFSEYAKSR